MRIISLLFIGVVTFVIVLVVKRPDLVKDFWLWLIGFSGLIMHGVQILLKYLKEFYAKASDSILEKKNEITSKIETKKP